MQAKRRILDIAIAFALLVCAALLLVANVKKRSEHNAIDRVVVRIASPLEGAVSWVVGSLGDIGNRYVWLRDVDNENRQLREDNAHLRLLLGQAKAELVDIRALESLLDFTERVPAKTVGARVIGGSLNAHFRLVRVRLATHTEEVQVGMPVVTGDGLVGRVDAIIGNTCEVLLITDPRSSLDVALLHSGGRGILNGRSGTTHYVATIEQLDRDQPVSVGDPVVTSGLGGAFPYGIPVGTVTATNLEPSSLYQQVEVAVSADLSRLDRVLILLTVPPPPATDTRSPTKETTTSNQSVKNPDNRISRVRPI